ncbi:cupredoxin family copper-binding protein [Aeromicrobium sp.]|nr:cupredoxin family copper-binding protein [Candidatus Saccharibacteria bacterium]
MKKPLIIGGIVALVVVLAGGGLILANQNDSKSTDSTATTSSDSMSSMKMSDSSSMGTTGDTATSKSIEIKSYAFNPASITVKKGTRVTWTNQDAVKHNVVTDTEGKGPNGELLAKGESFSYTFDEVGTFNYHCTPHPYMKAKVTVTE